MPVNKSAQSAVYEQSALHCVLYSHSNVRVAAAKKLNTKVSTSGASPDILAYAFTSTVSLTQTRTCGIHLLLTTVIYIYASTLAILLAI